MAHKKLNTLAYLSVALVTKRPTEQEYFPGNHLQPSLIFLIKAGAYLSGAPLEGKLLALPANNRSGRNGLPKANSPAYLTGSSISKRINNNIAYLEPSLFLGRVISL